MNEEQSIPEKAQEEAGDTSRVFLGEGTLQSKDEFENDKVTDKDDYYEVDKPKKDPISSIGDGEMRNEGTVGDGSVPDEENLFAPEEPVDIESDNS